jgi:hypothetical protein
MLSGATPVFRYQFNEGSGTAVTDTGDNGANPKNNGTLVGNLIPTWVPGPSGQPGDFALQITNAKNPANTGDPYFKHVVAGAVITVPGAGSGPFQEGLVQLSNNVDPANPSPTTPDLSSVLNGSSSLVAWVKTTATGDNNSWAAPAITGAEGNGLTNDIRWGYLDASGRIGMAIGDAGGVLSSTPVNDGSWHLVVLSRNATNQQLSVYIDGALSGQAIRTNNITLPIACHFNVIGAATDTGNQNIATIEGYNVFNGALDDVRVFDHVLSPAEIQALLPPATSAPNAPTNPATTLVNGLVKVTWTDNAANELSFLIERTTPDPANPANPDNSKWVQVGSAGAVSGSGQQGSFTDVGSAYSGGKFFYRVRAFNSFNGGSFSAYATTPTAITLPVAAAVDRYQFNEAAGTTTTADSGTPGGKTGTLSPNPPTVVPGPNGDNALSFNGTDSFVDVTDPTFDIATKTLSNNASVAVWVNTIATNTGAILGSQITSAPIALRWGFLDGAGHIGVGVGTAAGIMSKSSVNDGQWHLVVMTRDEGLGTVKVYVDGVLETTATGDVGSKIAQFVRIGATTNVNQDGTSASTYTFFNGQLDDLRLYNAVLSQQDVYGLLPPTTHAPTPPTNLTGTPNGAIVTLNWKDQADNEFSYLILRGTSPSGPFDQVGSARGVAGTGSTVSFIDSGLKPGTTYYYEVEAVNSFNGGSVSAPAGPVTVVYTGGPGFGATAHYFNQTFWAGSPTVNALVGNVDFHWDTTPDPAITNGGRASSIFTGKIKTMEAGSYVFISNTDDDGYLYVNGVLVADDPGGHGERDATFFQPITLAANTFYNFVLFQTNSGGGAAGAHLKWQTPNMQLVGAPAVAIPPANLFTQMDTPAVPTALALDPSNPVTAHTASFTFASDNNAVVHFLLQRSSDNGVTWTTVNQIDPATASPNGDGTTSPNTSIRIEDDSPIPGQTYRYRVVAMNYDHTSAPAVLTDPIVIPSGSPQAGGIQAHFYNGELVTQPLGNDPQNFAISYIGPSEYSASYNNVDFDFLTGSPDASIYPDLPRIHTDSFSTAWTGKVQTDLAGQYTFSLAADNAAVMYVNGVLVAQAGGASTPLTLAANTAYNFVIVHNDLTGNANVHASWIEPGQTTATLIPPGNPGAGGNGGFLAVMSVPGQSSVTAGGVLTENPANSAAGSLAVSAPVVGAGVNLSWSDQSLSELWFEVQRTTADPGNPNNPDNTKWATVGNAGMNATSFNDATATAGVKYFYRVRGANFDALGPFSNVVSGIGQSFTVNGTAGNDTITLKQDADGTHIDVTMGASTGQVLINDPNGVTINSGGGSDTVLLDTTNGNPLPNLLTFNGSFTTGALNIGANQTVVVGHSASNNGATLDVTGLTIDPAGKLNLNNNVLKVHYGSGATPASTLSGYLGTGRAGGAWNGFGIDSGDAGASGGTTSPGLVSDTAGAVTVQYARNGDANGDGTVNFTDLVALAQHYGATGQFWYTGDFTYDGTVSFPDLVILAQNYNATLASSPVAASPVSAAALAAAILPAQTTKPASKPVIKPTVKSVFAAQTALRSQNRASSAVGDVLEKKPGGTKALLR